jgi:hypothetical protein
MAAAEFFFCKSAVATTRGTPSQFAAITRAAIASKRPAIVGVFLEVFDALSEYPFGKTHRNSSSIRFDRYSCRVPPTEGKNSEM